MTVGRAMRLLVITAAVVVALFDVTFAPRFSLPRTIEQADPDQEARFEACFEQRDAAIHAEAFGTIDNPDVQRDFINRHRETARRECRQRFPERTITVDAPLDVNVLDFDFRWN
ncbi:MAG: hypothetical protein U5K76_01410 [Woeseiaceae bacterium]|nr:hypothetical protein [Woeseiaceae bacterium]